MAVLGTAGHSINCIRASTQRSTPATGWGASGGVSLPLYWRRLAGILPPRPDAPRLWPSSGRPGHSVDCIGVATVVFQRTDVGRGGIALLYAVLVSGFGLGGERMHRVPWPRPRDKALRSIDCIWACTQRGAPATGWA